MKKEIVFVCQSCGHRSGKWLGKCPECGEWNSLVEETSRKTTNRNSFQLREVTAVAFTEIESQDDVRIPSGVNEFDRVLGGGIVPGTLVLIGGDPGIGKSTLLLQVADKLSATGSVVLYVSGEESERQIKLRGERLAVEAKNVYLLPETNLENIINEIDRLKPGAIIVDSIQTVFSGALDSAPGSVSQVREVAHQILVAREESRHSDLFNRAHHERRLDRWSKDTRAHRRYGSLLRRRATSQPSHRACRKESLRRCE